MTSKETLEEAFEKWADQQSEKGVGYDKEDVLKFGAKWQEKRMYSYMEEYADYCLMCSAEKTLKIPLQPKQWFEQFKKPTQ